AYRFAFCTLLCCGARAHGHLLSFPTRRSSDLGEGAASWPVLAWAGDVPNWRLVGRPVRGAPYRLSVERIRVPAGDAGVRLWARGANTPRAHRRLAVVRLAEQLLPVGVGWLTDLGEIDLTLPRHADALEAHRRCGQRYGGVEAHLRANAVAGRRVELGTLGFVDKHQIAVGLETRRHCPLDFGGGVDVDIAVDHHHMLDVIVAPERAEDDVLRLALRALVDLHVQVVAAHAAARQVDVTHARETATQVREHGRLPRNAAQQQVLQASADDGMEHRRLAMGDGIDLDHMPLGALAVVLRELAERPFLFARISPQAALDDDLGIGRHANAVGDALGYRQWPAMECTSDFQLIMVNRHDRLRGHQRQRVATDHHRNFQVLVLALGLLEEGQRVTRQQQRAEAVATADLQAVD